MHYSDGTEAKIGDLVIHKYTYDKKENVFVGILWWLQSDTNTCNGQMALVTHSCNGMWLPPIGNYSITLKDCSLVSRPGV